MERVRIRKQRRTRRFLKEFYKDSIDLAIFDPYDNLDIKANLNEKYPDLENKPHKAIYSVCLFTGILGESLLNKTNDEAAAGNKAAARNKAAGVPYFVY